MCDWKMALRACIAVFPAFVSLIVNLSVSAIALASVTGNHLSRCLAHTFIALGAMVFANTAVAQTMLISITNPPPSVTATIVGTTQFWPNAGSVGGVPISLRATLTSISAGDSVSFFTSGDNPVVRANTGTLSSTVLWEVFNAATGAPISGNPNFLITDIDGRGGSPIESVSAACRGLTSYTVNGNFSQGCNANTNNTNPLNGEQCDTNIRVSESGGNILAEGTQNQNGGQQEGYMQYSWTGVSSWVVNYFATTGGRWYVHDADGDVPFDGTRVDINLVDMATIKGLAAGRSTAPAPGEQITFEIQMSNAGPENATGGNLVDTLPVGLNLVSASATDGLVVMVNGTQDSVQWSDVDVNVNQVQVLTIVAEVDNSVAPNTTLTNTTTTALANESVCSSRDVLDFSFVVSELPMPSLTVEKSVGTATSFDKANDVITYEFNVTNTGNVVINSVTPIENPVGVTFNGNPSQNALSAFSPAPVTLNPGQSQLFTATYQLGQTDVDNIAAAVDPLTAIDNTASATGMSVAGPFSNALDSNVKTGFAPSPSLTILKEVSTVTTFDGPGDTITYQYTITNTGNITIDSVAPIDSGPTFNGQPAAATLSTFSPTSASIAPGLSEVFTATYVLQQADVDAMAQAADPLTAIDNSATATGDPVGAAALPAVVASVVETGFAPAPLMTVAKSVSTATSFSKAGDVITYSYELSNTGNVTINNAVPVDTGPTFNGVAGTNSLGAYTPASVSIAPNTSEVVTASYTLSQQDIDNLYQAPDTSIGIDNTASATGTPVGGSLPTVADSSAQTGIALNASLALTKSASAPTTGLGSNSGVTDAGDTIVYTFAVTNSGDVTIDAISIDDAGPTFNGMASAGSLSAISCTQTSLAPDQSTNCSATYTLAQTDIDNAVAGGANSIDNVAEAQGQDPNNVAIASPSSSAQQSILVNSSIEINKTASAPTIINGSNATLVDPGDSIAYQLEVDNTGNTTLSAVLISDSIATVTCPATTKQGNPFVNDGSALLEVGDGVLCSASYIISQPNLDNGGVQNIASVVSTDPANTAVNDMDTVTSGFTQKASVSLLKSATALPNPPNDGDLITYTFELTNTGNVSLESPQVVDPICETPAGPLTATNGFVSGDFGVLGEMEAGETWFFECDYTIDQTDVNLGEVANTATGSGTPPASTGLASPSSTASNLAEAQQNAAIALDKSSTLPTVAAGLLSSASDVGDTIEYSFEVKNVGNVTLTNVSVTDPLITAAPNNGTINCPTGVASMNPGDTVTCTATYTLTQPDIDAGMVGNMASATGTPPASVPPLDAPVANSTNAVDISPSPGLSVSKSVAALSAPLQENDIITYTVEIFNTGNVTINGVTPLDSGPTFNGGAGTNTLQAFNPSSANLAPNTSQQFMATYSLSQPDIDQISAASDPLVAVMNSASATGAPVNGSLPPINSSTAQTGAAPAPSVELVKSSTAPTLVVAGELISYRFELQNTGNVTLSNPVVNDSGCSAPSTTLTFASGYDSGDTGAVPEALDVGETWVFECSYQLQQSDINAGTVQNSATGGGQDPSGSAVEDQSDSSNPNDTGTGDNDPTNTPLAQTSSWSVDKSTASSPMRADDELIYEFIVRNTGNVDINSVNLSDAKCATIPLLVGGDVGNDGVLTPTEVWTYTCTSVPVTQIEVNNGQVNNQVQVTGLAPPSAPTLAPAQDNVSTNIASDPALEVSKSVAPPTTGLGALNAVTDSGDQLVYTFNVLNTGNVTVNSLAINDSGPTFNSVAGAGIWSGVSCAATQLQPQQSTSCTATYTLDQADLNNAVEGGIDSVENSAQATGQAPDNSSVSSLADTASTSIESAPMLEVLKTAAEPTTANGADPILTDPGDEIDYTITVENTGNTLLSNVLVTDSLTTVSCGAASPSGAAFTNAGDLGSVLAVGDTVTCIATLILDQPNINDGQVVNSASVAATDPAGDPVSAVNEAISPFTQKTSLAFNKTASQLSVTPPPQAGDLITYTFTVENTGNVTLADVEIQDPQCQIPAGPLTATNGLDLATDTLSDGLLDAGETWTFTCDYAITTPDILGGEITNTASVTGIPPQNSGLNPPSGTSSALVKAEQSAAITLDKVAGVPTTAAGNLPTLPDPGDTVTYTFTIENTGNIPYNTVSLIDPVITDAPNNGTFVCILDDGLSTSFTLDSSVLNAGERIICNADYTLTQADVDNGLVTNTATARGNPPGAVPPPSEAISGSVAPVMPAPSLTIDKSASSIPVGVRAGADITYTYFIENTGNITISNVAPIDLGPTFNGVAGTNALSAYTPVTATLAPGENETFTATYTLSQPDLDNMAAAPDPETAIDNTASVEGEPANGMLAPVVPDTVETGVLPSPSLNLIKGSSIAAPVAAGSIIEYQFSLTNTGNVTISNPLVNDPLCQAPASPLSFTSGYLSGDTGVIVQALDVDETWLFSCEYAVSQANVDAGTVPNSAQATGQDPANNPVQDTSDSSNAGDDTTADNDPTNTALPRTPSWTIDKSTTSVPQAVGDTLEYQFILSNTGNTTISAITVNDAKCVGGTATLDTASDLGADGILSPAGAGGVPAAEQWTYQCTSVGVTQQELDDGVVINEVSAVGTAPGGGLADATDRVETMATQTPSMSLVKAAGATLLNDDGSFDQTFDFELKNLGNQTLDNVSIVDDIPSQFGACFVAVSQVGVVSVVDRAATGGTVNESLGAAPIIATADSLGVQDSLVVTGFTVTIDPNAAGCSLPSPAQNTATANSDQASDVSDSGTDPDAAGPNDTGVPTEFTPPVPNPEIGLSKEVNLLSLNEDFSFDAEFTLLMQNTGDVDLSSLSLFDDMVTQFGAAFTASSANDDSIGVISATEISVESDAGPANLVLPIANTNYDGGSANIFDGSSGLLGVGDVIRVVFTVRIEPTNIDPVPTEFENTAETSSLAPDGSLTSDFSNSGDDPTDGAGGGESPTLIALDDVANLPITLGQFKATALPGTSVLIQWQTQTEVANLGFNLYGRIDDQWVLLNPDVIAGSGDSVSPVDYQFTASTVAKVFALSDIDARATETLHGPFIIGRSYGKQTRTQITDWSDAKLRRQQKRAAAQQQRRNELLEKNKRLKEKTVRQRKQAAARGE